MSVIYSFAQGDFEYNGIWYNVISMEEGKVEVAGSYNYYNYSGEIVIPEIVSDGFRVTGVAENAFMHCKDLTSVSLPEGITYIGDGAFYSCI